jgi:hypothetical protein
MVDLATIQYQKTCMDTLPQLQFCHSVQIFTEFSYRKKIKNGKFQPKIPPLLDVVFIFFNFIKVENYCWKTKLHWEKIKFPIPSFSRKQISQNNEPPHQ